MQSTTSLQDPQVGIERSTFEMGLHGWHDRNGTTCMCTTCRPKPHSRRHKMTEVLVGGEICSECHTSLNEIIFEGYLHASTVEVIGPPRPNFIKGCEAGKVPSVENRLHEAS